MALHEDSQDISDRKIKRPILLTPFPKEEINDSDTSTEKDQVHRTDHVPRLKLPSKGIDQRTTQVNISAVKQQLASSYFLIDPLSLDGQTTQIMTVIRDVSSTPKLEKQSLGGESYVLNIRKFVKSSGAYALSSLASPLISLVLAPFLTRNLSHADYGALAVLNTAIALMAGVTQLGLGSAFFRSYNYDYESKVDRSGVLSTVVILLTLISIPVTITIAIAAPLLAPILLGNLSYIEPIRWASLVVLLQNFTIPAFAWLRAEGRALTFSMLSISNLLITLGATIVLLGVMHMGIAGSLIATGMGYSVVIVIMLPLILIRAGIHLRIDIARGLLSFGLPNVTNFVSVWILQLSDRYLLSHLGSLSQTASYAVAYSLGGVLSAVVIAPFTLAWPTTMYSIAKKDNAPQHFQLVFRWFSMVLLFAAFGLSFVSTVMLDLLFPPTYLSAAPIIPIIAASIMFFGVYNIFTTGVSIRRKTWFAVAFTTTSALINIVLNLVLIPLYGSIGAALSTLIAYAILALMAYIVNQRLYPIPFEIGRFAIALLIGGVLYVGANFLGQSQGKYVAWGIYLGALGLYGCCLVLLSSLPTLGNKNRSR